MNHLTLLLRQGPGQKETSRTHGLPPALLPSAARPARLRNAEGLSVSCRPVASSDDVEQLGLGHCRIAVQLVGGAGRTKRSGASPSPGPDVPAPLILGGWSAFSARGRTIRLGAALTSGKNGCWVLLGACLGQAARSRGRKCLEGAWTAGHFWVPHNTC